MLVRAFTTAIFAALLVAQPAPASAQQWARGAEPLPADSAFVISARGSRNGTVAVSWRMPPGYYLYRSKIRVQVINGIEQVEVVVPEGEATFDEIMGRQEVFRGQGMVFIKGRISPAAPAVKLQVTYQGCLEGKVCYPPMHKLVTIPLGS